MFCKNCGKEIDDNAVVCPHCGVQVSPAYSAAPVQAAPQKNTIALVGFILSLFTAIIGLICSIVGLTKVKDYTGPNDEPYKGFAIAGIIIGAIETFCYILYIIIIAAAVAAVA